MISNTSRSQLILLTLGVALLLLLAWLPPQLLLYYQILKNLAYYVVVAAFACFLYSLWSLGRREGRVWLSGLRSWGWCWLAIVVGMVGIHNAAPLQHQVLWDEYAIQSTARGLHEHRQPIMAHSGADVDGVFNRRQALVDKRPIVFPFLVSLAHDLTGFRMANALYVNQILGACLLILVFGIGARLGGAAQGGLVALALMLSSPLWAYSINSGGLEILNLLLICALWWASVRYLCSPDAESVNLLAFTSVLLVGSRYESVLFCVPVAIVIVLGWLKAGRLVLTWGLCLVPFLLLVSLIHLKYVGQQPAYWELKEGQSGRFSFSYLASNWAGMRNYLFDMSARQPNSALLSLLGSGAAIVLAGVGLHSCIQGRWRKWRPETLANLAIGSGLMAATVLTLFYCWGRFDDPMASRFSFPLCLGFIILSVWLLGRLGPRACSGGRLVLALWAAYMLASGLPKYHEGAYLKAHFNAVETNWAEAQIDALAPRKRLIISYTSGIPWVLRQYATAGLVEVAQSPERLEYHLRRHTFAEVLVLTAHKVTAAGRIEPYDGVRLPEKFETEVVAQSKVSTYLLRIERITGIKSP